MDSPVFRTFQVLPSYGTATIALKWTVDPAWRQAGYVVQRSSTGVNGWSHVGNTTNTWFDVRGVNPNDKFEEFYFRVLAGRDDGSEAESPVVSTFGQVSRKMFGAALKILKLEHRQISTRTPAKLLKLNPRSTRCPVCTDPDTGQQESTTLCGTCFGTGRLNAYLPALSVHVWFMTAAPKAKVAREDGAGLTDEQVLKARMMAFPPLDRDDIVVEPEADRRWLVETVQTASMNSVIPVTADVTLRLLSRQDARYKLPT